MHVRCSPCTSTQQSDRVSDGSQEEEFPHPTPPTILFKVLAGSERVRRVWRNRPETDLGLLSVSPPAGQDRCQNGRTPAQGKAVSLLSLESLRLWRNPFKGPRVCKHTFQQHQPTQQHSQIYSQFAQNKRTNVRSGLKVLRHVMLRLGNDVQSIRNTLITWHMTFLRRSKHNRAASLPHHRQTACQPHLVIP